MPPLTQALLSLLAIMGVLLVMCGSLVHVRNQRRI